LIRLETKRLVVTRMGEATPERGGRRKRYYQLTPAGQVALRTSLEAIRKMTRGLREVRFGEQQ
jgi:DNA-binding PadR family transcriptional regulator